MATPAVQPREAAEHAARKRKEESAETKHTDRKHALLRAKPEDSLSYLIVRDVEFLHHLGGCCGGLSRWRVVVKRGVGYRAEASKSEEKDGVRELDEEGRTKIQDGDDLFFDVVLFFRRRPFFLLPYLPFLTTTAITTATCLFSLVRACLPARA